MRRLRDHAERHGASQTALVERYVDEGVRMDQHPLIHFRSGAAGRRPAVLGSRLDVATVVETIRQNENSVAAAAEYLAIPLAHAEAAAAYYAAYQDDVDAWLERVHREADEAEAAWRRRHELFA